MERLQLHLLGGFEARTAPGGALVLPTRKTEALLAFLAMPPGQTHPRGKLASLLWGDKGQTQSRGNLRQALTRLRRCLGAPYVLRLDGGEVGLDPARVVSDVQRFEACAAERTPKALAEASRLYQGDFLAGLHLQEPPFEEWLLAQRDRLRELAMKVEAQLVAHHRRAGQLEAALQSALQLLTLDPLQEPVHRTLMRLYVQLGQRGAALRQYQVCTAVLERALRALPEPETKALYQQILTERLACPRSSRTASTWRPQTRGPLRRRRRPKPRWWRRRRRVWTCSPRILPWLDARRSWPVLPSWSMPRGRAAGRSPRSSATQV
jgi:DNA-binding SARP family transcriptional activator